MSSSSPFIKRAAKNRLSKPRQRRPSDEIDFGDANGSHFPEDVPSPSSSADTIDADPAESSTSFSSRRRLGQRIRSSDVSRQHADEEGKDEEDEEHSFSPMALAQQRKKSQQDRSKRKGGGTGLLGRSSASSRSKLSFGPDGSGDGLEDDDSLDAIGGASTSTRRTGLGLGRADDGIGASSVNYGSEEMSEPSGPSYTSRSMSKPKTSTPSKLANPAISSNNGFAGLTIDDDDGFGPSTSSAASMTAAAYAGNKTASLLERYGDSSINATGLHVGPKDDHDDGMADGTDVLDTTAGIPDEALIASAKAKRAAASRNGQNDDEIGSDFVSLSGVGAGRSTALNSSEGRVAIYDPDDTRRGPHPESRLQREDDEEGEGDEDLADYTEANQTLALGRNANKTAARRLKTDMLELIEDRENEELDDEDALEWERAQAERAQIRSAVESSKPKRKTSYVPAKIPNARPIPTVSSASSRISQSLSLLEASRQNRQGSVGGIDRDIESYNRQEQELREEVTKVEAKREWMEGFRGWVEILGGFLEEKSIEDDMASHYAERSAIIQKRRRDDDADDLALFLGVAPVPDSAITGGEIDELGRQRQPANDSAPNSGLRRHRRLARDARRARRRSRQDGNDYEDGFSTDSTLGEADDEDYSLAQEKLIERVRNLSDDVKAEDFRNPEAGLARRFGGWRSRYEEDYQNAYGGLAMVQAWEYWARTEMIGWEPSRSQRSLDSFQWYHALHDYSRPRPVNKSGTDHTEEQDMDVDSEEEPELGPEGDLVPAMVSSVVIRSVTKAIEAGAYDIYSKKQTRILLDLADMITEFVERDSGRFKSCLAAILTLFLNEIDAQIEMIQNILRSGSISPPAFDPAARVAMSVFTARRIKLMRNVAAWRRFAPVETKQLSSKLVDQVLLPVVRKSLDSGGSDVASKIAREAPPGLLPEDVLQRLHSASTAK